MIAYMKYKGDKKYFVKEKLIDKMCTDTLL